MVVGAGTVSAGEIWKFIAGDPAARSDAQLTLVVTGMRAPRTLAAIIAGGCLGAGGCLLQAVTRNPLAETGLLGVNAGAAFGVVAGLTLFAVTTPLGTVAWAFGGALLGCALVVVLARARSAAEFTPLRLVLAGVALGATLGGATSLLLVLHPSAYDQFRYWILGSLSGVDGDLALHLAPVAVLAGIGAAIGSRGLDVLALGDDVASSLGHHPGRIRGVVVLLVAVLTACAIALAGPISFVGLVAAFLARRVAGPRIGSQLTIATFAGATLVLVADIAGRWVIRPYELPVGVLVAALGAPLLVALARSRQLSTLGADRS
jgi:iron complex transport system permease protein